MRDFLYAVHVLVQVHGVVGNLEHQVFGGLARAKGHIAKLDATVHGQAVGADIGFVAHLGHFAQIAGAGQSVGHGGVGDGGAGGSFHPAIGNNRAGYSHRRCRLGVHNDRLQIVGRSADDYLLA